MVFMTDGDTATSQTNYSPYGVHWYDRRQTDPSSAPSNTLLEANVNARTEALCKAIKNKNISRFGSFPMVVAVESMQIQQRVWKHVRPMDISWKQTAFHS